MTTKSRLEAMRAAGLGPWAPEAIAEELRIFLEGDAAVVKIGFASNVANRLSALQTSSHHKLKILIAIKGSTAKEKELHRQFSSDHIRGEWFRRTQAIEAFIAANNDNVSERVGGTQSM